MTSQHVGKKQLQYILPNISKSKGNQTMKFGQLKEYNMGNIFSKNHAQNVVQKLLPGPFLKNKNWVFLWISSFIVCFYCMPSWGQSIYLVKLSCMTLDFTSYKVFFKRNRKRPGTSLPASFSAWFFKEKYLSCYSLLTDQISYFGCGYFMRYWTICVMLWRHKFWN